MKKLISLLLALSLMLSLAGCLAEPGPVVTVPEESTTQIAQTTTPAEDVSPETAPPTQPVQPEIEQEAEPTTAPTAPAETKPSRPVETEPATTAPETEPSEVPTEPTQPELEPPMEPTQPELEPPVQPTQPKPSKPSGELDPDGSYTTKEDVGLYIHLYGRLPKNFITKSQAKKYGWKSGALEPYAPGYCIGGDTFKNREGLLPKAAGRTYKECDIDTLGSRGSRGSRRIVFSNDGLIYFTSDHYRSFTLLYGEP